MSARAFRLPRHVRPAAYHIDLHTDPTRSDFSGTVHIDLVIDSPTSEIVLHSRGLAVSTAQVETKGSTLTAQVRFLIEEQAVELALPRALPAGTARLRIDYAGALSKNLHGLYLGTDGVHRAICSQCEATDARAIFPCFDEPEFKATLAFTLHTGPEVTALANGPLLEHTTTAQGDQRFRFAPTRPVSSYLAAVAIGDFEGCPEEKVSGIPLRVFAPRGKVSQTAFAQDFTKRLLPFYEEYFDFPYPFAKYDQVAVPGFDAGAMENVGLVLFRQNLLLMEPRAASWRQEKLIALVIAHEFAHMWFGNLVTMRWWDDLWLNEAFAEWMAHKAAHFVDPSYEVWNDFIEDKSRVLFDDALRSTHPIWTPVETPDEAIEMFDSITYQKGCAVMRMLENFLGEGAFRDGLRAYMKRFQFNNAEGADLWQALESASGQPVRTMMHSWVAQSGYPVIDLKLVQDKGGARLELVQQRFFSEPNVAPSTQVWNVPMVVRFEDDEGQKRHRFIFSTATASEPLPAVGTVRWMYANADEIGFYRQRPERSTLRALLDRGLLQLAPVEQAGLLEDQWALVRSKSSSILAFLDVLRAFSGVRDHNVLRVLIERFETLDLLVKDAGAGAREARLRLRRLVADTLQPHLNELGYAPREGEPQNDVQRRALVLTALANLARLPDVIAEAEKQWAAELADPRGVDPNLAGVLVAVAAKFGDESRFDLWVRTFQDRKQAGRTPQEVARYLHTLSMFRRPELPGRTLSLIDDGVIPQEAVASVLSQLLSSRHGQDVAWDFVKSRWEGLRERVGDMGLSRVVEAIGRLRGVHREDVVRFFEKNAPAGAERALQRALERMDQAEELRARITADLLGFLRAL